MEDTYAIPAEKDPIPAGEENILDGADIVELCPASTGQRLFNYIVDYIIYWVIYRYVIYKLMVAFIVAIYRYVDSRAGLYVISYLMVIAWYLLIRTAFEGFTGGKTIAKFMNGTRAVNEDGTRITFKTALLRSLSRMVPFEVFSALGSKQPHPWHDRWTRTYVIDESQSRLAIDE